MSRKYQRRQWHPTPVLLPGKSHGWRNLVGCGPWDRGESDTTERLHFHFSLFTHWRRRWQPTPVFLPGESQGWRNLVGCHLWGRTELDTTETTQQQQQQCTLNLPWMCPPDVAVLCPCVYDECRNPVSVSGQSRLQSQTVDSSPSPPLTEEVGTVTQAHRLRFLMQDNSIYLCWLWALAYEGESIMPTCCWVHGHFIVTTYVPRKVCGY